MAQNKQAAAELLTFENEKVNSTTNISAQSSKRNK